MKGHFSLRRHPESNAIHFGNLGMSSYNHEGFSVFTDRRDITTSRVGMLIAHDVVEHSVAHRHNYTVTVEQELRALGACMFVRGSSIDVVGDITTTLGYLSRPINKAPLQNLQIQEDYTDEITDVLERVCFSDDEEDLALLPEAVKQVQLHIAFGYHAKRLQFDSDPYRAGKAFDFIERHSPYVIHAIEDDDRCTGASVYFDTDKQVFRYRMKRQWSTLRG